LRNSLFCTLPSAFTRLETRMQGDARAGEQRRQRLVVEAAYVEQGQGGQHVVVLPQIMGVDRVVAVP